MGFIIFSIMLLIAAIVLAVSPLPSALGFVKKVGVGVLALASVLTIGTTAVSYNDAGYCQHVRTVFGTESSTCKTGWYASLWGSSTQWPHYITVGHTSDPNADGSSISPPYTVRMSDNWTGDVTETTRFGIPQDNDSFLKMARDFRHPTRLISTTLSPAVTASLDSIANLYSMEEYYAGGKRDQFKTEFRDAITKGRAQVRQISRNEAGFDVSRTAPNDSDVARDTSDVGSTEVKKVAMEKVLDSSGNVVREAHGYTKYGIVVSSAILENLDPDDVFEDQIAARKEAASRRIVAREQRKEQEEQRLLAITTGETDIARRQATAKTEQIQQTTEADTRKKLALIAAEQRREEAAIARDTAEIKLEQARIDAESVKTLADGEAYAKEAVLLADGALAQKLEAYVATQQVWADAFSKRQVPATVFSTGGGTTDVPGSNTDVSNFMNLMTMNAARNLSVDMEIPAGRNVTSK